MTGKEFKDLRIRKCYTQKEWGSLIGISASTISMIECGKRELKAEEERKLIAAFSTSRNEKEIAGEIYTLYTDGGCAWNPGGPGGIGVVILKGEHMMIKEISKGYYSSTNNRMEIMAAIEGLRELPRGSRVKLISDSQYLVNTMKAGWARNKNQDLWAELDKAMAGKKVKFSWVRGHNGDPYNERCDALATEGIRSSAKNPDTVTSQAVRRTEKEANKSPAKRGAMGIRLDIPGNIGEMKDADLFIYPDCKKRIASFNRNKKTKTFKDYLKLKTGGCDGWSGMGLASLRTLAGKDAYSIVIKYIKEDKMVASCLRWYGRGLPLKDSIRKTLVDQEVAQNCTKLQEHGNIPKKQ
uniref:RNase H family protein n=1 Tax=Lachnoclostridium phocaeense TaxID=1871021 RepID=UPI002F4267A6